MHWAKIAWVDRISNEEVLLIENTEKSLVSTFMQEGLVLHGTSLEAV